MADFQNNWKVIYEKLEELRKSIIKARGENLHGLHRLKQMPFFRDYKKQFFGENVLTDQQAAVLIDFTQDVTEILERELRLKGFWDRIPAQNKLKAYLLDIVLSPEYKNKLPSAFEKRQAFISSTMQKAKMINETILYR